MPVKTLTNPHAPTLALAGRVADCLPRSLEFDPAQLPGTQYLKVLLSPLAAPRAMEFLPMLADLHNIHLYTKPRLAWIKSRGSFNLQGMTYQAVRDIARRRNYSFMPRHVAEAYSRDYVKLTEIAPSAWFMYQIDENRFGAFHVHHIDVTDERFYEWNEGTDRDFRWISIIRGDDPTFFFLEGPSTPPQPPKPEYRELVVSSTSRSMNRTEIGFCDCGIRLVITDSWFLERGIDVAQITKGRKVLIKGTDGNEDADLCAFKDALRDFKLLA